MKMFPSRLKDLHGSSILLVIFQRSRDQHQLQTVLRPSASLFNIASNTFSLGRCHSSTRGTGHLDGHPKVVMVVHLGDHPKNIGQTRVVMFQITRVPWESEFRSPFGPDRLFFLSTWKSGDPSPNPSVAKGSLGLEKHQSSQ